MVNLWKINWLSISMFCLSLCFAPLQSKAQDTTYYDQEYYQVNSRMLAHFMEIKKCAADNENKCSLGIFSLDSNRIVFNWRYSDYKNGILHGRSSRWYSSGALYKETMFEAGKKQGIQKIFYPNGQLKKEFLWEQDSLMKGTFFNLDGTPMVQVFKEDLAEHEDQTEPSFPGGLRAMYMYLNKTVEYPEEAKENGWQGQVVLTFVVGKRGEIVEVNVVETPYPILSNAVVRAVKQMPRWQPFRISGIPVRVRYTLPFKFKLE